ncbi:MAG TPA: alpha-galactosidase [Steroidobacteraceae bacterium]|nr:alpha-galactosidase [Steroidobacteraceae bacterium]
MRHQHRSVSLWILLASTQALGATEEPVRFNPDTHVFTLSSPQVTYAFGVNEHGELQSLYWGGRRAPDDTLPAAKSDAGLSAFDPSNGATPQEYPAWGSAFYTEPALKVSFPDGNRDLVLHYLSHTLNGSHVSVLLKDISRDVRVELRYDIDPDSGILARSARIENHTGKPLFVQQSAAATWNLPSQVYVLYSLSGRWAAEWHLDHRPVLASQTVLESRRGSTGQQNNPWFALAPAGTSEDTGPVWFGALAWSGSWRITVEPDVKRRIRVTGGYNPFDFSYRLSPGESLDTPVFFAGYTPGGLGEASRLLHRFELTHLLPQAPHPLARPVLYNSWEATEFNVNEAGQMKLAEMAARIGVERFVMDDGWFGARDSDHAGLGDWVVNPRKFPHGLQPLIDRVHALGMDFGLWVEPEMVNPDSDLYRRHPDWVLNFPGRPRTEGRHQLVLNLAREDVRDHLFRVLDDLLTRNDIAFLKWDYNRNWSEPGWPEQKPEDQQKVYVSYIRSLYWIMQRLRERHPKLEIESCSGGGGRVDLGIMRLTDEVWPSDNTDPFDRLSIQDGFTYAYAPGVMMAWVTDSPNWVNQRSTSLEYRFLSSMQGSLGIGADLTRWNEQDFQTAKRLIFEYKSIRMTVQQGLLYRLISPRDGNPYSATQSVSSDGRQAVLFAFLHSSSMLYPYPRIHLKGLDPQARYRLRVVAGKPEENTPVEASGAYWASEGIELMLKGDFQAAAVVLDRVAP